MVRISDRCVFWAVAYLMYVLSGDKLGVSACLRLYKTATERVVLKNIILSL